MFLIFLIFSKEEWLGLLEVVKCKLGLKENMQLNGQLVKFLDVKRKSDSLQDKMDILDLFDDVLPTVDEIYKKKICERDIHDEFQIDNVAGGISTEDGMFYYDYFLPSTIFYMYQSWVKTDVEVEIMFKELFNIGGGSATPDLFPEIHGICEKCAGDYFQSLESKSISKIQQINKFVFKAQKNNLFLSMSVEEDDSEDDENKSVCNPFESDDEVSPCDSVKKSGENIVNPFASSNSESDSEEIFLDSCEYCHESFPSADYVNLHKKLFHSSQIVQMKFVENPESLMTTFVQPDNFPHSPKKVAVGAENMSGGVEETGDPIAGASRSSKKNKKYNFRKRLKY